MPDHTLKHRSQMMTGLPGQKNWPKRAAARAMLRAVAYLVAIGTHSQLYR